MTCPESGALLAGKDACENLTRFAVAGGMPRYLSTFGRGSLRAAVVDNVLDRRGGLFNEVMALLHN